MQKIYINTTNGSFFNSVGESFASGYPKIAYKSNEEFCIQLCTESPDSDTPGSDPDKWKKDKSLDIPGISAFLSVDKDFQRRRKGTLAADIPAGSISELRIAVQSADLWDVRSVGTARILLSDGSIKKLSYDSVSKSGGDFILSLRSGESASAEIPAGTVIDVPDSLYIPDRLLSTILKIAHDLARFLFLEHTFEQA